ncbi:MAG: tetratricopeptide repeat protein [Candidatus Omnitrophota bacterium]
MKKINQIRFIIIGLALNSLFVFSGCSEQYKMERMVWHADLAAKPIFVNEGGVPSYEFNRVLNLYKKIIDAKPGSGFALDAKFKIAKLYIANKEFDKARLEYDQIIADHKENKELAAGTLFLKGQSYEQENQWPQALNIFEQITEQYDKTSQSLSVPMYIARYYMKNADTVAAVQAYKAAIAYFQKTADAYPSTKVSLLCENLIVRAYMEMSSWQDALTYIDVLDKKYKLGPDTLMVMAQIYKEKLNDPVKTQEIYDRILKEFPDSKAAKSIKQQMEQEKK